MKIDGQKLKQLIERRALTQTHLARILGVSRMTLNNWISGRTGMHPRRALLLANILNAKVEDLQE